MYSLITILFGHWAADFLLQTETMALNKSHSLKWLAAHVLVYTVALGLFALLLLHWEDALMFAGINGMLHGVTDFFTSKLTAAYSNNRRIFFLIIGLDQFIHTATLLISLGYFIPALSAA